MDSPQYNTNTSYINKTPKRKNKQTKKGHGHHHLHNSLSNDNTINNINNKNNNARHTTQFVPHFNASTPADSIIANAGSDRLGASPGIGNFGNIGNINNINAKSNVGDV